MCLRLSWCVGALVAAVVAGATTVAAQTSGSEQAPASTTTSEPRFTVRTSLKGTGVLSDPSRDGLVRGRIEPSVRIGTRATFDAAYEQRLRFSSTNAPSSGSALGVLPSEAPPPYRLTPLDWEIASNAHSAWRHEIDRAVVHLPSSRVDLNVGRQAIGWGRGVLFGAIDLFSPFSPFEVDREWRRGVDAVRVETRLSSRSSSDVVLAFGERPGESAYAARLRGYGREVDVEAVGGWRAGDAFGGAATSFVLGPAEVHGEVAVFDTPAVSGSAQFGGPRTIVKVVVGGSSRVPVGTGLLLYAEYHYSGFGVPDAEDLAPALFDPEFVTRVVRGDTQILTRHAVAVVGSYKWSPTVAASASVVHEPTDGSGVFAPSLTLTFGNRWSVLASGYLTYGAGVTRTGLQSAYGASPNTAVIQVRFYR